MNNLTPEEDVQRRLEKLRFMGLVKPKGEEDYELTEKGWAYLKRLSSMQD